VITMSVGDIAALTGGRLEAADPRTRASGPVVVDSRQCGPGAVFVALVGDHTDGHLHVSDAFARGAVVAVAARPIDGPAIVVDNPMRALGFLAGGVLRRTTKCRVIGITGSSGKTSTKDLVAAVLSRIGETVAAAASLNNEIGLPLSVLGVTETTRDLVLEYSARGIGHIAYLCRIAPPQIAAVLNVGSAHLGEFGSREVVAAAKGELIEALDPSGVAVLGVDDPVVAAMRSRTTASVIGFGTSDDAEVRVEDLRLDAQARPTFLLRTADGAEPVTMQLSGAHQAMNAAAAAAISLAAGVELAEIADSLAGVTTISAHRMQVGARDDGLLVVDDAYNANPESMRAALDALAVIARERSGTTWAVLGEMRELGDDSPELHAAIGRHAASAGIDRLVAVAEAAEPIVAGARSVAGWRGSAELVPDGAAAAELLRAAVAADDVVLVKASNALRLWRVADALLAAPGDSDRVEVGA
jgi:UDP-N-acetylmuramoyl-tripeptide--D-alanyl-D-alanine ligase